ncbi:hypothetical protein [Alishewanella tabrizica]|uniref:SpoVT-AbrB domain-containing protein n=1 Tax=Alishewanella tabrizica TaxID=671278 RepID=A0ABQ2WK20_9ALTE|nr:hypothetical protein [Alishewanella tabrizica]GGW57710.1 hypothetical protein GCM10008111_12260 [Alishewanella tabrizica]
MSYRVKIGRHNEVELPDALCQALGVKIGDIMVFEASPDSQALTVTKHNDQTLTDDQIAAAKNLSRIIPHPIEDEQHEQTTNSK